MQGLTCFEMKAGLESIRLSQAMFGRICGTQRNTVWRWCDGSLEIPHYAAVILSALAGASSEDLRAGRLKRFRVEVRHVFPKGYSRAAYLKLVKRFHPDNGRENVEVIKILNAVSDRAKADAKKG